MLGDFGHPCFWAKIEGGCFKKVKKLKEKTKKRTKSSKKEKNEKKLKKMMQKDVHILLLWPRGLLGLRSPQGVPMTCAARAF